MLNSPNRLHIQDDSGGRVSSLGSESICHCEKKYWMFLSIHYVYVSVCVQTCVRARIHTHSHTHTHKVIQKERSIFCDVIVSVIVRQKVHTGMCLTLMCCRDTAVRIWRCLNLRTRVGKCNEVDGKIFEHSL
jgi:hypothetical protein